MSSSELGTAAQALFAALTVPGAGEGIGRDGWLDVLSDTQATLNVLAACQAVAMAQVAAFDTDDPAGLGPVRHRGLGHVALDAPDLVAGRTGTSAQAASSRMGTAVDQVTTMPTLVRAMAEGRLDAFRAAVVTHELSDAPAEVRAQVVEELDGSGRLTAETAGPLRRRTRRLLEASAPEVLAARASAARTERGLHRSTDALGVDQWTAWLPVESSRPAWAAVTALAQDYLSTDRATTLAQARADALTDLLLSRATTTVVLHPTVALEDLSGPGSAEPVGEPEPGDELVPVSGYGTPGQTMIRRRHLDQLTALVGAGRATRRSATRHVPEAAARISRAYAVDPSTGVITGVLDPGGGTLLDLSSGDPSVRVPVTKGYRPGAELEEMVKLRDGRCRFPGCGIPVRFVDLDHVRAFDHQEPARGGATDPHNLVCLCRRHHRIKQRQGWTVRLAADGTLTWTDPSGLVRTSWPEDHRPATRSDRQPAVAAVEPARMPPDQRAAELEPYSVLEDALTDRLEAAAPGSVRFTPHRSPHRSARRTPRHRAELGRVARDHVHGSTPRRRIVLHPDTVAEFAAKVAARTAPPF